MEVTQGRASNPARVRTRRRTGGSVSGMRSGLAGVVLVVAAVLLGAGCSSGGSSSGSSSGSSAASSPSPSPSSAVCTDVAPVRTDAGGEWKAEIDELSSALATLQTTLKNISSQPSPTAAAKAVSTQL